MTIPGIHCPECGSADPGTWDEGAGRPPRCQDCGVDLVDGCDGCEHQFMAMDHLDEIAAELAPIAALFA